MQTDAMSLIVDSIELGYDMQVDAKACNSVQFYVFYFVSEWS